MVILNSIALFLGVMFTFLGCCIVIGKKANLVPSIRYKEFEFKKEAKYVRGVGITEIIFGVVLMAFGIIGLTVLPGKEYLTIGLFIGIIAAMAVALGLNMVLSIKFHGTDKNDDSDDKTTGEE